MFLIGQRDCQVTRSVPPCQWFGSSDWLRGTSGGGASPGALQQNLPQLQNKVCKNEVISLVVVTESEVRGWRVPVQFSGPQTTVDPCRPLFWGQQADDFSVIRLTVLGQHGGPICQHLQSQPHLRSVRIHQQQGLKDGQQLDRWWTVGHLDSQGAGRQTWTQTWTSFPN